MDQGSMRQGRIAMVMAVLIAGCGAASVSPSVAPASPAAPTTRPSATASPSPSPAPTATPAPTPAAAALLGPLPTSPLPADVATALQAVLDDRVAHLGDPDVIAAVITKDGTWAGAAGIDGPKGRHARPGDSFAIASISKLVLASIVVRLHEAGVLDLDAPLSTYLPDVATNGATVREALAMRSGIDDTASAVLETAEASCDRPRSDRDILKAIPAAVGKPGETYRYSNPTYKLLGFAAAHATGKTLAELVRTEAAEPAGAAHLVLQGADVATKAPWALPISGHEGAIPLAMFGAGGTLPCVAVSTLASVASGMAADAPTLARWGWQLFAGKLVTPAGLAQMLDFGREGYGLGVEKMDDQVVPGIGHGGHATGYASLLTVLPKFQTVVVVFVNDEDADVTGITRDVLRATP